MNAKNETQYIGIGLIFGSAIGAIIGILTSQLALLTAIGSGLGLIAGSILRLLVANRKP